MKNKFNYSFIVIPVILVAIIFNSFIFKSLFQVNKELLVIQSNLSKTLNSKDFNKYKILIDKLDNNSNDIKNIDHTLTNLKEEYFNNVALLEQKILNNESTAKIAYITIDDGPYDLSSEFLDVLRDKKVQATFFSMCRAKYDYIRPRIINEGHTQGNHTCWHNLNMLYSSTDYFINNVLMFDNLMSENYGVKMDIFRFPAGSSAAKGLKNDMINRLKEHGYGYVDWDVNLGDGALHLTVDQSVSNVINGIKDLDIAVVLMHDYNHTTLKALPIIIDELRNDGYLLLPLFKDSIKVIK